MNIAKILRIALPLALISSLTYADQPTVRIPTSYLLGVAPPIPAPQSAATKQSSTANESVTAPTLQVSPAPQGLAHSQSLDGTQYAIVFPVFAGANGNYSYLRLGNGHRIKTQTQADTQQCYNTQTGQGCNQPCGATPTLDVGKYGIARKCGTIDAESSDFTITVVGSPSGQIYGSVDYIIPPRASPQYSIGQILSDAGVSGLMGNDTQYALYIFNPDYYSFYQHVIYNGNNQFFEDMTYCKPSYSMEGGETLTNVHTSSIPTFPSTIYLHNFDNVDAAYRVDVIDSSTGNLIGTIPSLTANANSTYAIPESFFESQLNFTPTSNQVHISLVFTYASDAYGVAYTDTVDAPTSIDALLIHFVNNNTLNASLNISNHCTVNPP